MARYIPTPRELKAISVGGSTLGKNVMVASFKTIDRAAYGLNQLLEMGYGVSEIEQSPRTRNYLVAFWILQKNAPINPRTCECGNEATDVLQGEKGPIAYVCPSCKDMYMEKYRSGYSPYTKVDKQDPLIKAPWNIRRDSVTRRWMLLKHNEVMLTARTKPELLRKIELGTSYTKKYQQNPRNTLIYGKVNRIVATKTQKHICDAACKKHGHRYYHDFSSTAQMYGLPDGSLLIKSK